MGMAPFLAAAGELERRQQCQWPLQEKKQRCSLALRNDGGLDRTRREVQALFNRLTLGGAEQAR